MKNLNRSFAVTLAALLFFAGCATRPGTPAKRKGDEIMVAGQMFHTGTKVVLWTDPGGYDAYRVERRFAPLEESDWATTKEKVKVKEADDADDIFSKLMGEVVEPRREFIQENALTAELDV